MKMIVNLTQHPSTPEQQSEGVVDFEGEKLAALKDALTFEELPEIGEITGSAEFIAELAAYCGLWETPPTHALIGGAPFLMAPLEDALRRKAITPLYAFSRRESVEERQSDGSVRKVNMFRHAGFVPAVGN